MESALGPERPLIRPPNEARSVLVRVTRGCNWNRCRFCGIYSALGQPAFEVRPVADVIHDIQLLAAHRPAAKTAFLGDADPLVIEPTDLLAILQALREALPHLRRITAYGRAATVWRRRKELPALAAGGLSRLHVGLETGDPDLLRFHRKGISRRRMIDCGRAIRNAGIELSYYVLLGLGGADRWQEHIDATVDAINEAGPEFVRLRRLWIFGVSSGPACPLSEDVAAGRFQPQTPEGTVLEARRLIAGIRGPTHVESAHHNDYVRFEAQLPDERDRVLSLLDDFLAAPAEVKAAVYAQPSAI